MPTGPKSSKVDHLTKGTVKWGTKKNWPKNAHSNETTQKRWVSITSEWGREPNGTFQSAILMMMNMTNSPFFNWFSFFLRYVCAIVMLLSCQLKNGRARSLIRFKCKCVINCEIRHWEMTSSILDASNLIKLIAVSKSSEHRSHSTLSYTNIIESKQETNFESVRLFSSRAARTKKKKKIERNERQWNVSISTRSPNHSHNSVCISLTYGLSSFGTFCVARTPSSHRRTSMKIISMWKWHNILSISGTSPFNKSPPPPLH